MRPSGHLLALRDHRVREDPRTLGFAACNRYFFHREFILCCATERRVTLWVAYRLDEKGIKRAKDT